MHLTEEGNDSWKPALVTVEKLQFLVYLVVIEAGMAIGTERVSNLGRKPVRHLGPHRTEEGFSKNLIFNAMRIFINPVKSKPRVTKFIDLAAQRSQAQ